MECLLKTKVKPGPQGTMCRRKGQMFEPGFQLGKKAIKALEVRPILAMFRMEFKLKIEGRHQTVGKVYAKKTYENITSLHTMQRLKLTQLC